MMIVRRRVLARFFCVPMWVGGCVHEEGANQYITDITTIHPLQGIELKLGQNRFSYPSLTPVFENCLCLV